MSETASGEALPLLAYERDRLARVHWNNARGLELEPTSHRLDWGLEQLTDHPEAVVLDGRGILRNAPDLAPLAAASDDCQLWVDSGVRRGEDVVDVVMADVANPIVAVRHLADLAQLEVAAEYCEELMVALDWAGEWVGGPAWQKLGLEGLAEKLSRWEVDRVLVNLHQGPLPYSLPRGWEEFTIYIAFFDKISHPWPEARTLRPLVTPAPEVSL